MFQELGRFSSKPNVFEYYTAADLWTDDHISSQMLAYHLNEDLDISSRNHSFIDQSVVWIWKHFNLGSETRVADFGCGPGLYTSRLARKGATVMGIDFSPRSIEYAREQAARESLQIDYVEGNYLECHIEGEFDLIIMIMCDFCALSPKQRATLLGRFRSSLKDDGAVLLDVYSLKALDAYQETAEFAENLMNGFWSPERYFGFRKTFKYEDERITLDKYTIVEENRTRTIYNWLQYYSQDSLSAEFEENGFQVAGVYSDVAGARFETGSSEFAVIARPI